MPSMAFYSVSFKYPHDMKDADVVLAMVNLMMTSSNGNIFCVTGPLCREFNGHRRGALMFSVICAWKKRLSKQSWRWWFERPSSPLWRHCNANVLLQVRTGHLKKYAHGYCFVEVWYRSVLSIHMSVRFTVCLRSCGEALLVWTFDETVTTNLFFDWRKWTVWYVSQKSFAHQQ